MEVLHGKSSGPRFTRRRADKISAGENRTLHWVLEESDIHLHPHSPLAFADVLAEGGSLALVADPSASADSPKAPEVISDETSVIHFEPDVNLASQSQTAGSAQTDITLDEDAGTVTNQTGSDSADSAAMEAGRHKKKKTESGSGKNTSDRLRLLTRHPKDQLLAQCKRILVENALVKNKGDRQLYLAAGFLSWPDSSRQSSRHRAPLLLYPALLARVANEPNYEIRLNGEIPEVNEALLIHIEQLHSIKLPGFDEDEALVDYFARIADSLQPGNQLELEMEVAVGSASLVQDASRQQRVNLPDVPLNFDVGLAMSITGNKSLQQLSTVLSLIPDFTVVENGDAGPDQTEHVAADIAGLRRYAAKLAAEGLDHMEFKQLPSMPGMIRQWRTIVRQGMSTSTMSQVLRLDDLSARELVKLSGIIELIDKAPVTTEQLGHPNLCFSSTTLLLRRAQHQAKLIDDELDALQEYFLLDRIPSKQQLLTLISELGEPAEAEAEVVGSNYVNARRRYLEFSRQKPAVLSAEDLSSLSHLAKVLRFRELFVNNGEYRSALGPGYRGLRTDWTQLGIMSDYARELSTVIGSETIAARIMETWPEFRKQFSQDLEKLQQAADATRRLLSAVGTRWQTQSIPALLGHAKMIAQRLEEWQAKHGTVESHADKTAASVLASFSGESLDSVLVESQVDETHSRISRQLSSGAVNREQVSDTLSWLQEASTAAASQDLDIDAIVQHLQIA